MNFEEIKEEVKKILSEKRFKHCYGVAKRAAELARIYKMDEEKASLVGMVHDIAKEMPTDEALLYAKENGIIFDEIEEMEPKLWHCKIGADIAGKKFGFTKDMQQAIMYHTTGNVNMEKLDKIIYIADKTDETRSYETVEEAIKISNENLDEGVLFVSKRNILYSLNKGGLIHPNTIELMNKILKEKRNNQ